MEAIFHVCYNTTIAPVDCGAVSLMITTNKVNAGKLRCGIFMSYRHLQQKNITFE